jgi:hypothetical protein
MKKIAILFSNKLRPPSETYEGAIAYYSLRRINDNYTTDPAITVRRSSDNNEYDILFTENGQLDTNALLGYIGENSAYVKTWYDQSGNGNHATQSIDTGKQPRIVNNGNLIVDSEGLPTLEFNSDRFNINLTISQSFVIFAKTENLTGLGALLAEEFENGIFVNSNNQNLISVYKSSSESLSDYLNTDISSNPCILTWAINNANINFIENLTLKGTRNKTFSKYNLVYIGESGSETLNLTGKLSELIIGTTPLTTNLSQVIKNMNNYYQVF